jgi:energy-coupling factor transporter ATP-binding protein EcfA2
MNAKFPQELLKQSSEERIAYFEAYTVGHPKLKEATQKALRLIGCGQEKASCITIFGPTGVGKTTLLQKVEQALIEQALPKLEIDRGCIPVVKVEAISPDSGSFNWKDYFTRSLIALEEPLIDHKINYGAKGIYRSSSGELVIDSAVVTHKLRLALENALKYRHPTAFLIDEAQHIQKMASGRRLQDNMDCIKSIANITRVPHVLVGTYEILAFRNLSGQLTRRTKSVHLPRYQATSTKDMESFKKIIFSFQCHLPLEEQPDLLSEIRYLYERSLGCTGILKDWLVGTLSDALEENAKTIHIKHLQGRARSVSECKRILQEIEEGEKELEETQEDLDDLRTRLGIGGAIQSSRTSASKKSDSQPKNFKRQSNRRVGTPNPKRRKVGKDDE